MLIAIEGCTHGELDATYATLARLEEEQGRKVDLLLCCGDFQSVRNLADLTCMAVPDKYKEMGSFYKYYSGEKQAPVLTVFIGGNHEASNYLQELPYGGWVAPNIYYLGLAGVLHVESGVAGAEPLRLGGLSGIYKGFDYLRGHFEQPPYDQSTQRSVYHIRNLETFRLKQLSSNPPDVMVSHDWPRGITQYGDVEQLLRFKRHFHDDIENNKLGSQPTWEVLETLQPEYWFSAHLHCKFAALVEHEPKKEDETTPSRTSKKKSPTTKFLALDKCLPRRRFLQILDVGPTVPAGQKVQLKYDAEWLAILKSTDHLFSSANAQVHMPGPGYHGRWDFRPTDDELEQVQQAFESDLTVPMNFEKTVPAFDPSQEDVKTMLRRTQPPRLGNNAQTEGFCRKLDLVNPCDLSTSRSPMSPKSRYQESSFIAANVSMNSTSDTYTSINEDEIPLDDDDEDDGGADTTTSPCQSSPLTARPAMVLPAPKRPCPVDVDVDPEEDGFTIDTAPSPIVGSGTTPTEKPEAALNSPKKKVMKRRNLDAYSQDQDE